MMRRLLGIVALLWVIILARAPLSECASTAVSPTSSCDEHPWDKIKDAYRVEFLVITDEYVVVAVWYTKEQVQPVIIRIELRSNSVSENQKTHAKKSFIFTE